MFIHTYMLIYLFIYDIHKNVTYCDISWDIVRHGMHGCVVCGTHECITPHMNASHHTWMHHTTHECVTPHVNERLAHKYVTYFEARDAWMRHMWHVAHMNAQHHTWMHHTTHECVAPHVSEWLNTWIIMAYMYEARHGTESTAVHIHESWHTWMRHTAREWVREHINEWIMVHMNEARHTWMRHWHRWMSRSTHKCVMARMDAS